MKLDVIKVKTFQGIEGGGYNAVLVVDDKPVAFVIDEGCGGTPRIDWHVPGTAVSTRDVAKQVLAWIETQSLVALGLAETEDEESCGRKLADLYREPCARLDMYLAHLVDKHEDAKRFKRLSKTNVIAKRDGKVFTIKIREGEDRARVEALVLRKWPDLTIMREF